MTGRRPVRKRAGSGKGMLLVVALVIVFMLVVAGNEIENSAESTLLDVVHDNIDDVEYDDGFLDLDELNFYRHNVYIQVYDAGGELIRQFAYECSMQGYRTFKLSMAGFWFAEEK